MYDFIIKNAAIIDGTGSQAYYSAIGVKDGKIARISKSLNSLECENVIDGKGLVCAPGFIDSHSHSDVHIFSYPSQVAKLEQGITTNICGMCGSSVVPRESCLTFEEYNRRVSALPLGDNIAVHIGHSTIRRYVMGMDNRKPTEAELEKMKDIVREAMSNGAMGMSVGLIYPPSCYADMNEITELVKVVGEYNGDFTAHMRNESDSLIKSVDEIIKIARCTGVRTVISHHKAVIKENWGKSVHTLAMIDKAASEGLEIYADQYPYIASGTGLKMYIPRELHAVGYEKLREIISTKEGRAEIRKAMCAIGFDGEGNGADNCFWRSMVAHSPSFPEYNGMRISEIAETENRDQFDVMFDILHADKFDTTAAFFTMDEGDVERIMKHPRIMAATDCPLVDYGEHEHPRHLGSFPRILGRYVRERKVITLEEAIRKMTSLPAQVYNLRGKGLIKEGFDADITIFNPDKIIDNADFRDPYKKNSGLNYVIIDGKLAVKDNVWNGTAVGKLLKNSEYRAD